jgi:DNA modification methylase
MTETLPRWQVRCGDALTELKNLPDSCVHTCVTSPPYFGLRDYGIEQQLGLEETPDEYVGKLVGVFREVRRVLRHDGTLWVVIGDSYSRQGGPRSAGATGFLVTRSPEVMESCNHRAESQRTTPGLKEKDLIGIPWMLAFALRADGWYLRGEIVWAKGVSFRPDFSGSCMPESVRDRPTRSHETVFLLSKSPNYFYDHEGVKEAAIYPPGSRKNVKKGGFDSKYAGDVARIGDESFRVIRSTRNLRSVWAVNPQHSKLPHFAMFPEKLIEPMIRAGTSERGCCGACGAPWLRVVARPEPPTIRTETQPSERDGGLTVEQGMERSGLSHFKYDEWLKENPPETIGWVPSCSCRVASKPCTVLDPFTGSGTTGIVTLRLKSHFLGIELNSKYVEIARGRLYEAYKGFRGDS